MFVKLQNFISANSYEMLDSYYKLVKQSGIAQESALFDKLISTITNENNFDHIIVDTAPTEHTLRLFKMSQNLRNWSQILLKQQEKM